MSMSNLEQDRENDIFVNNHLIKFESKHLFANI